MLPTIRIPVTYVEPGALCLYGIDDDFFVIIISNTPTTCFTGKGPYPARKIVMLDIGIVPEVFEQDFSIDEKITQLAIVA